MENDKMQGMIKFELKRSFKNSAEVKRAEESYGYTDHTLYGRSGRCRQDLRYGSRACSDGRNTERNFFAGRDLEKISPGCATGNFAGT